MGSLPVEKEERTMMPGENHCTSSGIVEEALVEALSPLLIAIHAAVTEYCAATAAVLPALSSSPLQNQTGAFGLSHDSEGDPATAVCAGESNEAVGYDDVSRAGPSLFVEAAAPLEEKQQQQARRSLSSSNSFSSTTSSSLSSSTTSTTTSSTSSPSSTTICSTARYQRGEDSNGSRSPLRWTQPSPFSTSQSTTQPPPTLSHGNNETCETGDALGSSAVDGDTDQQRQVMVTICEEEEGHDSMASPPPRRLLSAPPAQKRTHRSVLSDSPSHSQTPSHSLPVFMSPGAVLSHTPPPPPAPTAPPTLSSHSGTAASLFDLHKKLTPSFPALRHSLDSDDAAARDARLVPLLTADSQHQCDVALLLPSVSSPSFLFGAMPMFPPSPITCAHEGEESAATTTATVPPSPSPLCLVLELSGCLTGAVAAQLVQAFLLGGVVHDACRQELKLRLAQQTASSVTSDVGFVASEKHKEVEVIDAFLESCEDDDEEEGSEEEEGEDASVLGADDVAKEIDGGDDDGRGRCHARKMRTLLSRRIAELLYCFPTTLLRRWFAMNSERTTERVCGCPGWCPDAMERAGYPLLSTEAVCAATQRVVRAVANMACDLLESIFGLPSATSTNFHTEEQYRHEEETHAEEEAGKRRRKEKAVGSSTSSGVAYIDTHVSPMASISFDTIAAAAFSSSSMPEPCSFDDVEEQLRKSRRPAVEAPRGRGRPRGRSGSNSSPSASGINITFSNCRRSLSTATTEEDTAGGLPSAPLGSLRVPCIPFSSFAAFTSEGHGGDGDSAIKRAAERQQHCHHQMQLRRRWRRSLHAAVCLATIPLLPSPPHLSSLHSSTCPTEPVGVFVEDGVPLSPRSRPATLCLEAETFYSAALAQRGTAMELPAPQSTMSHAARKRPRTPTPANGGSVKKEEDEGDAEEDDEEGGNAEDVSKSENVADDASACRHYRAVVEALYKEGIFCGYTVLPSSSCSYSSSAQHREPRQLMTSQPKQAAKNEVKWACIADRFAAPCAPVCSLSKVLLGPDVALDSRTRGAQGSAGASDMIMAGNTKEEDAVTSIRHDRVELCSVLDEVSEVLACIDEVFTARTTMDASSWRYGRNRISVVGASYVCVDAASLGTHEEGKLHSDDVKEEGNEDAQSTQQQQNTTKSAQCTESLRSLGVFMHETGLLFNRSGEVYSMEVSSDRRW